MKSFWSVTPKTAHDCDMSLIFPQKFSECHQILENELLSKKFASGSEPHGSFV
jgi:hypothetical protein